jgi:predicted NBD/HSP70 family sugar kinase
MATVAELARSHGWHTDPVAAVADAAHRPEAPAAAGFLAELGERIGDGAANVCAVLDPGLVVLGGSIGAAGAAPLAESVQAAIARRVPLPTDVRPARLGAGAALTGARLTALDRALETLFAD